MPRRGRMSRQIRHDCGCLDTPDPLETTLGEVRKSNLYGSLYPHPPSQSKRTVLQLLRMIGLVEWVPPTAYSLGGWFARPRDSATLRM